MENEDFEDVYVDVNSLPLRPPQPMIPPEKAVRRPWHPVMWDDSLVGIPQPDLSEADDEVDRRPRWEAPYITFADALQALIKNSRNLTDVEREMCRVNSIYNYIKPNPSSEINIKVIKTKAVMSASTKTIGITSATGVSYSCYVKGIKNIRQILKCYANSTQYFWSPRPQSRGEYPHKQRIRNLRKLIADGKVKPTPETLIFFLCNKFAVSDERQKKVVL